MTETGTFEEFVTSRSPAFLRLAYALTRDHTLAEDLLQTTLARSWPAWKRIVGDPEPYVRRVLVNTYSSWWRRRWNGERPTDVLPEQAGTAPQSDVDDRDAVWRALGRLPKRQRAVLVLRYFEDLSESQIAETLNMAPGTVKSYAAKGLAQLRRDPGLLTVPEAPPGTERLAAVQKRVVQNRRVKLASAAAACVAIVILVVGYASGGLFRTKSMDPITPSPDPSEYFDGHRVVAAKMAAVGEDTHFSWTPSTFETGLVIACTTSAGPEDFVFLIVNGERSYSGIGCQEGDQPPARPAYWDRRADEAYWRPFGVELGKPADISLEIRQMRAGGSFEPFTGAGHAAVWIGEKVRFAQYPLPARPKDLLPLRPESGGFNMGKATMLRPGGGDSAPLVWGRRYGFAGGSNTPGYLRIHIDGVLVHTIEWWDYQASNRGYIGEDFWRFVPSPVNGRQPVMTVTTEHITADWYLAVYEAPPVTIPS